MTTALIAVASTILVLIAWYVLRRAAGDPPPVRDEPISSFSVPRGEERAAWLRSVRVQEPDLDLPVGPGEQGHEGALDLMDEEH